MKKPTIARHVVYEGPSFVETSRCVLVYNLEVNGKKYDIEQEALEKYVHLVIIDEYGNEIENSYGEQSWPHTSFLSEDEKNEEVLNWARKCVECALETYENKGEI